MSDITQTKIGETITRLGDLLVELKNAADKLGLSTGSFKMSNDKYTATVELLDREREYQNDFSVSIRTQAFVEKENAN